MPKLFLTSSLLLLFILFSVTSANGQSTIGLSLTPPLFEATVTPGKSISQVYKLTNLSQSQVTLVARIIPFTPSETGQPILKPNLRPSWLSYFSLKNTNLALNQPFALSAGDSVQLVLSLEIPYQTSPTDLYATLLISTSLPEDDQGASNTAIGAAIGSNLLITISASGNPPALVKIEDFAPIHQDYFFRYGDHYFVDTFFPIHFTAMARNVGKYFTKTSGQLTLSQNRQIKARQELIPLNLLSFSSRYLEASPTGELVFSPKATTIGTYQVALDIKSDNSTSHAEISLVFIPARLLGGLIISLILLLTILKFKRHHAKSKR